MIEVFPILVSSANGVCQYLGPALEGCVSAIANGIIAVSWPHIDNYYNDHIDISHWLHIDKSWELDKLASLLMVRIRKVE